MEAFDMINGMGRCSTAADLVLCSPLIAVGHLDSSSVVISCVKSVLYCTDFTRRQAAVAP